MITKIIIDMRFFLFVRASSCPVYASLQEGLNIHPPLPKQVLGISVVGYGFCLYLLFQVDILEDPRVPEEIKSNYGTVLAVFLVLFGALNGLVAVGISPETRRMTIDKTTYPRLSFHLVVPYHSNWDYDALNASKLSGLSTFVFVLFCVTNTIILLNLLIALMADR